MTGPKQVTALRSAAADKPPRPAPFDAAVRGLGAVIMLGGSQLATQLAAAKLGRADHASELLPFWMWIRWAALANGPAFQALLVPAALGLATTSAGLGLLIGGAHGRRKKPPSESHGSARWATTDELRAAGLGTEGVVLCQEDSAELQLVPRLGKRPIVRVVREAPLICAHELHVLVEASTGMGKGEGVVLPTALSDRGRSVVFLDPSGELWEQSAGWRSLHSRALNVTPCAPGGIGINPLMEIPRGIGEVGEAERIAHVLVGANEREKSEGLVYWQAAEKLLTAAFLYVLYFAPRKSLPGTRAFLADPNKRQREVVADMAECGHEHIRDIAHDLMRMGEEDRRVIAGAFTTALNVLSFCTDPLVADTLDRSDFVAEDLNQLDSTLSVYVSIPERETKRLQALTRLITNVLVGGVSKRRGHRQKVLFVLDEFCAFGALPALADGIADLRKYGVQLVLIVQDRSQIFATYKDNARPIINNCGVQLASGVNDPDSAGVISKMLGKRTVEQTRKTQGKTTRTGLFDTSRTATEGETEHARELMTLDEVRALDSRKVLLFATGVRGYRGVKVVRYADRRFAARALIAPPSSFAGELPPRRQNHWSST